MESVFYNGGMIGATLDFGATDQYIISQSTITHLGYISNSGTVTSAISVSLTGLGLTQGDLVIGVIAKGSAGDGRGSMLVTESGWTEVVAGGLYANDTYDANLKVYYKVMGASPDTTFTSTQGAGSTANGCVVAAYAFRGVDPITPLVGTPVTYTLTNSYVINLPAITKTVANSIVVAVGAGAAITAGTYTSSDLTNFQTRAQAATNDGNFGIGWSSTVTDPAAWTVSGGESTSNSAVGMVFELEPNIVYGNRKNSGVWNIQAAYEEVYSNLPLQPVFTDTLEAYSGWTTYGTGVIQASSTQAYEGTQSILKTGAQGDPNGGFKLLGTTVGRPFTLECWIYSVGPRSVGTSDRIFISDSSYNGYGFNVSSGSSINVERRTGGTGTALTNSTSWTRTDNVWYRVKLVSNVDNTFTMTVFNTAGTQLATVTSVADTTYTGGFDRIVIVGGYDYYVDNIRIWNGVV